MFFLYDLINIFVKKIIAMMTLEQMGIGPKKKKKYKSMKDMKSCIGNTCPNQPPVRKQKIRSSFKKRNPPIEKTPPSKTPSNSTHVNPRTMQFGQYKKAGK